MQISAILNACKNLLIIGHIKPDGDCFGAGLSLLYLAERLNKNADFVCDSTLNTQYSFMHGFDKVNKLRFKNYDTVICVDCGDKLRLGKYQKQFNQALISVNIDHHLSNNGFAKENLIMENASSTCEIIGNMLINEGLMDKTLANLIYVGLSTDSGHFAHNNTTADVFLLASKLLNYGADAYEIVKQLYRSVSVNKLRLTALALQSMRFSLGERVCIISIKNNDLINTGCTFDDTEGIINYAISLKTVEAAACICEYGEGSYKVSLRSKEMDISKVAARFGGGGHKHASGCMAFGEYEDVLSGISRAINDEFY